MFFDLQVMSKFMNIGMPFEEVDMRFTSEAAKLIRRPELGSMSIDSCADITIIRIIKRKFGYMDCGYAKITDDSKLDCMMTIRECRIIYDPNGLSLPD